MQSACYCTSLRSATRRITAIYDEALAPYGVNIAQFALLRAVRRLQPVALTELGEHLELDRSTIGRNVRVLERAGLVTIGRGEDQREATVALSDKARRTLDDAGPAWDEVQASIEHRLQAAAGGDLKTLLAAL